MFRKRGYVSLCFIIGGMFQNRGVCLKIGGMSRNRGYTFSGVCNLWGARSMIVPGAKLNKNFSIAKIGKMATDLH